MPAPASPGSTLAFVASLLALAFVGISCTGGSDSPDPGATPCVRRSAIATPELLPDDIPIDDYGDVVAASRSKGFINVEVVTDQEIVAVDPPLQRSILDAGYEILSHDNEGFEAEIFFARSSRSVGTIIMREGPCAGQATLKLRLSREERKS